MSAPLDPPCVDCAHYDGPGKFTCAAFPKGVPEDIMLGRHRHTEAYKGDKGIRYQKKGAVNKAIRKATGRG